MSNPDIDSVAAPWARAERYQLGVLAAAILVSLPFYYLPWFDPTDIDASLYLLLGQSLARGEGYAYLGAPAILHPPGLPVLLLPILGTIGTSFPVLNLLGCLFGAAAVLLLFVHQRERVGGALALATATCLWLDPGFRNQCNRVMSDVPGLALLLLCLLLERRASRAPSWSREVLLGLAIGISSYIRPASILLVPAIVAARVLARLTRRRAVERWSPYVWRRLAVFALMACTVLLPWKIRNIRVAAPPPADQTLLYTITTGMWHTDPGDPRSPRIPLSEILARPRTNARSLLDAIGSGLQSALMDKAPTRAASGTWWALAGLLALSLAAVLLRRREAAEIYAAGMTVFFLFYFTFATRLALPIYVFALAAFVEVLGAGLRRLVPKAPAFVAAGVLLLFLILANLEPHLERPDLEAEQRRDRAIAASVTALLTPEDRLASTRGPRLSVYLDRPVYNLAHAIRRAGRLEAAEEIIDKYGIDTVVLRTDTPEDAALVPYFTARYGPGRPADVALLWKVRAAGGASVPQSPARQGEDPPGATRGGAP